ncbi:MAG: DUF4129 domain-containing protein [Pirellulaceae bacterium]
MNHPTDANDPSLQRLGGIVMHVAGPALAILAVASLACFLIEITYSGAYVGRVKWIFALFSFAAVLISRISIEEGQERATMFGFFLAFATLMVAGRFMQGNIVVLAGILAFVWWVAGRLTWDITFIDETRDASGQGMIDMAIGRVEKFRKKISGKTIEEEDSEPLLIDETAEKAEPRNPWDIFVGVFFRRRQPNTPGLWAFYFLLAGLPLFGIGQLMMRTNDAAAHSAATFHFFVYMVAILLLLMLSSVLGLHRYLNLNNSWVPMRVARHWIITGTILAIGIIGFTFLLPRPTPQYSIGSWLPRLTNEKLDPSSQSFGQDGQKQSENNSNVNMGPQARDGNQSQDQSGEGKSGGGNEQQGDSGQTRSQKNADNAGGNAKGQQKSSGKSSGKQKSSQSSGDRNNQKGQQNDGKQKGNSGDSDQDSKHNSNQGESEKGEPKEGDNSQDSKQSEDGKQTKDGKGDRQQKATREQQQKQKQSRSGSSSRQRSGSRARPPSEQQKNSSQQKQEQQQNQSSGLFSAIGKIIKFLMWIAAAIVIAWFAFKHREQIMPWIRSFLAEMAEFWNRLWNRKKKVKPQETIQSPIAHRPGRKLPGFSSFKNPFAAGLADSWSPEQLVVFTFQALEAWSRDQQCPRDPETTALEFAKETGKRFEPLAAEAANLGDLYSRLAYARGSITRESAMRLSRLWDQMASLRAPQMATIG